jgi:hypothetical protein
MTAQPGERTVSWLDEDDPNRGAKPFVPVESVIDLTATVEEPQTGKNSRREKPPKPPKPPRGKLWRRDKATQEKPPRENPPRDVTPRAEDWPAPASEDWLTTLRGQAPPQDWAASRDTKPRDAGPASEWPEVPDEAPRNTGPHPAWAAAPEGALEDSWDGASPPLDSRSLDSRPFDSPPLESRSFDSPSREEAAPAAVSRETWFGPREARQRDDDTRDEGDRMYRDDADSLYRDEADRSYRDDAVRGGADRQGWGGSAPNAEWDDRRDGWDSRPDGDPRAGWDNGPDHDPRAGRDSRPDVDRRDGWNGGGEQPDRRVGWGAGTEQKARPDWLTSLAPAAPDAGWSEAEPRDAPIPEAFPAPLDITPDDDLDEQPTKRRRPRPSGPPTGDRSGGRTGGRGPRRRRKSLMVVAIALTAVVAAAAVVAAGTIYRLVFDPGTPGSHTIAAPLGGRKKGELELATAAETVTVTGADLGDDLFQVITPESGDPIPLATIRGERTTVTLASNRGEAASAVEIRLNSRVTWRLLLTGGAKAQAVDLSAGNLSGLEVGGRATRLELTLPKPAGTVPIRLRGGLDELVMHAPQGVLARVKVTKGASTVALDRLKRSKVAADTTFTPNGWAQAKARYDVVVAESIGTVKLDRR